MGSSVGLLVGRLTSSVLTVIPNYRLDSHEICHEKH